MGLLRSDKLRVALLALGTFAIGTEDLLIAGILPQIASDLSVSVATAGQLVTVYALTFAVTSPLLIALTSRVGRKRLLMAALLLFGASNALAAVSHSYGLLFSARILAACAAGIYSPTAIALAPSLVAPHHRGKAIAVVTAGFSVALVLGVPLGTWIGHLSAWQTAFVFVAVLAATAAAGMGVLLPETGPSPAAGLRERLSLLKDRRVLSSLAVTLFVFSGAATFYTYIAPVLERIMPLGEAGLSGMLLLVGLAGTAGNVLGGTATDRWGAGRTITAGVLALGGSVASFSVLMDATSLAYPGITAAVAIAAFGVAWYVFIPPMNHRLIALAPEQSSLVVSLMGTALFLGVALGAAAGGIVVDTGHLTALGWVAAAFALLALGLDVLTSRKLKRHQASEAVPSA